MDIGFTDLVNGGETGGLILTNYVIEEFDTSPERFDYMVNSQDFGFNHANCIGGGWIQRWRYLLMPGIVCI